MELVRDADVFLTNFLPERPATKLHIEVEDIRAANPTIIYVRGSGHGQRGRRGGAPGLRRLDVLVPDGLRVGRRPRRDSPRLIGQPAGAFGDSMGGAMMAGGIAAALFARERTR